jgi:FAD binding domain-containing protein/berberine-like enzyme
VATIDTSTLEGLTGEALRPGDPGYDEARSIHNGLIDKRPALIVRCSSTADVVGAVNLARETGLEVSVRGGGHNVAGIAVCEGGLMIDLSPMKAIHVDVEARTARAEPGVIWAELNEQTQAHGLAVTGGAISTTGIAGLTLGGGLGWLMSKLGLAADQLLSAEVVTADGRVLTASASENEDLFWGLRGGGGNFGVVTSFEYRLHPIGPMITGGLIAHPFEAAGEVIRFLRDFTATQQNDDLIVFGGLVHAPDGSGAKLSALVVAHFGTPEEAQRDLAPMLAFGSPLMVQVGEMPYVALNSMLDDAYPKGALNYWRSSFLSELSDAAIDTLVGQFAEVTSPMTGVLIEHFHGAVTRVPLDATAVWNREPGYNLVITSVWMDPAATDENVAWTRGTFEAMRPFFAGRRWVNYLDTDDAGEDMARAAYGGNYDRLVELKTKYDPGNLFRLNINVAPKPA